MPGWLAWNVTSAGASALVIRLGVAPDGQPAAGHARERPRLGARWPPRRPAPAA